MWKQLQWSLVTSVFQKNLHLIAIALLGVVSLGLGTWGIWRASVFTPSYFITVPPEKTSSEIASKSSTRTVFTVDVAGAVVHPGIYELSEGSRAQDAVLMAGGFQATTDLLYVHQKMNLSKKLKDQDKIYIPFKGELPQQTEEENSTSPVNAVNSASKAQLLAWPGIGEKRAEDIISNRPYTSLEDFLERSGVPKTFVKEMQEKGMEIVL